jgi:M6 family metalloprotease-like protein
MALYCGLIQAVPAWHGLQQVLQPDGSTLTIQLHGDEYLNYATTADGYTIIKNAQGYYVYAKQQPDGQLSASTLVAHDADKRHADELAFLMKTRKNLKPLMSSQTQKLRAEEIRRRAATRAANMRQNGPRRAPRYDYKKFKGLVILVEYKDTPFSNGYKELITEMITQDNYKGYNDTDIGKYSGSVRDYFRDNSYGEFVPDFEIIGPYAIDSSRYSPMQTENAWAVTKAAVDAADKDVDFKDYDRDNDGVVDMIYFIFSGHSAHYTDHPKLIWPHASYIKEIHDDGQAYYVNKDNVRLGRYACSTELMGNEVCNDLEGRGTICHEFSHVLGLPDLYDVGSTEDGGLSNHPLFWSLMASGNQLNNGRTPAGYGMYERYAAGFATPQLITDLGTYQINPIGTSNVGYRMNSGVDNEFFLMEYRHPIYKWDKYLPGQGMLVYRVDSTDVAPWNENKVNADPEHNCYELIRAGGGQGATSSDPFPGAFKVTKLGNKTEPANLLSHSGIESPFELFKIAEYGSVIAFDVVEPKQGEDDNPDDPQQPDGYGMKYWFDDQKELAGQIENYNAAFSLDVSMLSDGVHALHVAPYDLSDGIYLELPAQTYYFIKQPMMKNSSKTDYIFYIDGELKGRMSSNLGDLYETNIPMQDVQEGVHLLTTMVKAPGEASTMLTNNYFLRVPTAEDLGSVRLTCRVDNGAFVTLQHGFVGDSLNYELDVKDLEPGLHRLTWQLTSNSSGLNTPAQTAFFMVDPKLSGYEYWLNDDFSTLKRVERLATNNAYEVAGELKLPSMPIRSSKFHFTMENNKPMVYAINDLTVRFFDNGGGMTDSTMQYIDVTTREAVMKATLLELNEPTTVIVPDAGKIKWFRLEAYRGDGIRLQASRPCAMQLFAPDGEEIYHVSGDAAKVIAGTNGLLTGTYYVAVHDISDTSESREITVTYYPGASILTEQPMASLADSTMVYRHAPVTLTCNTPNAVIWYSTDGTEPSLESETTHRYDGNPIRIEGKTLIRAIATCNNMLVSDEATYHYNTYKTNLRWDFSKRWQWISHNMADDMDPNELYDYVEYMQSETQEVSIINGQPVVGSMDPLTAMASYKVKSVSPAIVERKLDQIDPAITSMELHKGWNWIGYPIGHSQTLDEAFGNQAREGDIISGQLGYAIFENGQWYGTLMTLDNGRGYLLMSKSNRVLTFRDVGKTTTEPQKEPFEDREGLKVDIYAYPVTMNITAQLYVGNERQDDGFAIGAFCGDECRGVAELIDGRYYLTVYGNDEDAITLKAVKAHTLELLDISETFQLTQEAYGSRVSPLRLSTDFPTVVTVTNITREYGEQNPELAYTIDGAALRGIPQLSCEADQQSAVGEYPIVIDKGSVENMNVTYVGGTLTVTKAPLTVYVDDYSRLEGEENPIFTILYDGFKNGETPDVLIEAPTVSTDATIESPMGEYDIIVSGGKAQNYEFIYVNGKLTVTEPPSYTITYVLDGEVYTTETLKYGATIVPPVISGLEDYTIWEDVPETMPAKDITIYGKAKEIIDGIDEVKNERVKSKKYDDAIYDLSGRKINCQLSPVTYQIKKGIYIQNGHKVAVK